MIRELEKEFDGKGEVKGYSFKQLKLNTKGYLYQVVNSETNKPHYEIFKRKLTKRYDFEKKKKLFEKVVLYPKSNNFGDWAWTSTDIINAVDRFDALT